MISRGILIVSLSIRPSMGWSHGQSCSSFRRLVTLGIYPEHWASDVGITAENLAKDRSKLMGFAKGSPIGLCAERFHGRAPTFHRAGRFQRLTKPEVSRRDDWSISEADKESDDNE